MMTRVEIESSLRASDPKATLPDGKVVTSGDPEYEALLSEWADRWERKQTKIPDVVSPLSFGLALIEGGISLATIEAMLDQAGEEAQWMWKKANTFRRNHPLILQFAAALEKTEEEVDAIFIRAKELDLES